MDEDATGGRGDRGFGGGAVGCVDVDGERLVAALYRHHRVVHRDRHVGEDRVPLGRRQACGTEGLNADDVPRRDVGVRWPVAAAARPSTDSPSPITATVSTTGAINHAVFEIFLFMSSPPSRVGLTHRTAHGPDAAFVDRLVRYLRSDPTRHHRTDLR